jgi:signal transduction histidine kinase
VGDPVGLARCLKNQAVAYTQQARPGEVLKVHEQEEALFRRAQASQPLAVALLNQAVILADALHQPDAALSRAEEGARLAEEHALAELAHEIRPILERIRGQARPGRT